MAKEKTGLAAPPKHEVVAHWKKQALASWKIANEYSTGRTITLSGCKALLEKHDMSVFELLIMPLLRYMDKKGLFPQILFYDIAGQIKPVLIQRAMADDARAKAIELDINIGDPDWQQKMVEKVGIEARKQADEEKKKEDAKPDRERELDKLKECTKLEGCNHITYPAGKCIGEACTDYSPVGGEKIKVDPQPPKSPVTGEEKNDGKGKEGSGRAGIPASKESGAGSAPSTEGTVSPGTAGAGGSEGSGTDTGDRPGTPDTAGKGSSPAVQGKDGPGPGSGISEPPGGTDKVSSGNPGRPDAGSGDHNPNSAAAGVSSSDDKESGSK